MSDQEPRVGPSVEERAEELVAADERRLAGVAARRRSMSLGAAGREFVRHPSPYLIGGSLLVAIAARAGAGRGAWWELAIPAMLLAVFPLIEWAIHVVILHWKPRRVARLQLDSLLARKHREHHVDPRDLPLIFIPWPVFGWLLPVTALVAWVAMPTLTSAGTLAVSVFALMLGYEWTHYLIHSDYRPRSRWYRAVWRNHRLHHYKNENYWFTVTSAGTADRLLGTYPDPAEVETSPTVRQLHAELGERSV